MNEQEKSKVKEIALLGNPNTGKTTIFNALTGLRHSTANYPGVTVEKRLGEMTLSSGEKISVLDLPGAYSLLPRSPDEEVVHDVLLGIRKDTPPPDLVVLILDANNLERNLYLATQVLEAGISAIFVLNMWDMAKENGFVIDLDRLQTHFGTPCVTTIGNRQEGIELLKRHIEQRLGVPFASAPYRAFETTLPEDVRRQLAPVVSLIEGHFTDRPSHNSLLMKGDLDGPNLRSASIERYWDRSAAVVGESLRLLADSGFRNPLFKDFRLGSLLRREIVTLRTALERQGIDWTSLEAEKRYEFIESICREVLTKNPTQRISISEKLDRILTHRVWGLVIFVGVMGFIFQSIFTWASVPTNLISSGIGKLSAFAQRILPAGALESLVVDGVMAGVGNVVVFLPQIMLLFFFIALFEDIGYIARAVFVLDRLMKKVGLNGKAFLPLLSGFACAIPGIMATRTIEDRNDRLATILITPLMSCSARLPVYTLMIAAFIPALPVLPFLNLKGFVLLSMYVLSIAAGLGMAALFRKTFLKGNRMPFIFELPPYRIPHMKTVLVTMWDRAKEFLVRAGGIIFCLSIVLWFLVNYPKNAGLEARFRQEKTSAEQVLKGEELQNRLSEIDHEKRNQRILSSYAGRAGKFIEPAIKPLGFNWEIGIGLVASFAAREVIVSTLAIIHYAGSEGGVTTDLVQTLQKEKNPETGMPKYTPLIAVSLMVFYVLAMQCLSTIAVAHKETGTWRWPLFMIFYMTALAWVGSFVVYQGGRLLGFE